MAEVIPQINIDGTKIKDTWTEKEYVTDEVYNALNKTVIDLKNNNNLLDSNSILFREEYNSSSKNLNNAIHQGVYSFTSSAINAPSGVNGGNLLVTNTSKTNQGTSIITQIAFCHNGAVYARTKNTSESFTTWNKLAYITDNVASATEAGNINKGYIDINFPSSDFREVILGRNKIGFCVRPFSSQFANGSYPNSSGVGFGAGDTHGYLQVNYVEAVAYIGGGNNNEINWYKRIAFADGTGASGTWNINISGNASTATKADNSTKATQDSQGQQINTTYIKGLSVNNATLTATKGNGSTSTITVNNVNNAINANNSTSTAVFNLSYVGTRGVSGLSFSMEDSSNIMELLRISPNQENKAVLRIRSTGDYIQFLNCNNATQQNQLICNFPTSPTAPTPSTSDNSTKIATTAFVKSLFTASKETNGWHKEASTGFIWQWGQEANYHDIMDNNYGSSGSLNFPISFPNKCLAVMPYLIGSKTFCCVSVSSFTNATITVHWDEWARDVQSVKFGYIAVGY